MAVLNGWFGRLWGAQPAHSAFSPLLNDVTDPAECFNGDNNEFAVAMYEQLRQRPGNLMFSPYSIRTVLAMAMAGAEGQTAAQMASTLGTSSSDVIHRDLSEPIERLTTGSGDDYAMTIANSLWFQDGVQFQKRFLDLISRYYLDGAKVADFRDHPRRARAAINDWGNVKTNNRIRELIPSGSIDPDTRLMLLNAIYFKGKWQDPFDPDNTRHEKFHLETGSIVKTAMMHRKQRMLYAEFPGFQAVQLPYQGCDLSALIFLPALDNGIRNFERQLSASMVEACVKQLTSHLVALSLPRFKVNSRAFDVRDSLLRLGMRIPFDKSRADFSGINGYHPPHEEALYISGLYHAASVEVNEQGTEAAAFSGLTSMCLGMKPPRDRVFVFCASRPFLFAIRDRRSGALLFIGRVADPTRDN